MRFASGVIAIAGAVLVALGCALPFATSGSVKLRIFQTTTPHAILFYALEPIGVILAAAILGVLLLIRPPFRLTPGMLLGIGGQSMLFFVGFIGYYAKSDFGTQVRFGAWIGLLGAAAIVSAGSLLLEIRFWSGSEWTGHVQSQPDARGAR